MDGFYAGTYVRKGDWKLIRFYARAEDGSDDLELYNLKDDVGERHNLAKAQPALVQELNGLISEFLKDTAAVIPKLNPAYGKPGAVARDPLVTWKNRNCEATVVKGILTAKGTGTAPFLGVGAGLKASATATLTVRLRASQAGEGRIDLVSANPKATPTAFPYGCKGGEWQDLTVELKATEAASILRFYLPSNNASVEIDYAELKVGGEKARRWDF